MSRVEDFSVRLLITSCPGGKESSFDSADVSGVILRGHPRGAAQPRTRGPAAGYGVREFRGEAGPPVPPSAARRMTNIFWCFRKNNAAHGSHLPPCGEESNFGGLAGAAQRFRLNARNCKMGDGCGKHHTARPPPIWQNLRFSPRCARANSSILLSSPPGGRYFSPSGGSALAVAGRCLGSALLCRCRGSRFCRRRLGRRRI